MGRMQGSITHHLFTFRLTVWVPALLVKKLAPEEHLEQQTRHKTLGMALRPMQNLGAIKIR